MRRREFFGFVGGLAVAWPFTAQAQQSRIRRIGYLAGVAVGDVEAQTLNAAFLQGLQQLGWAVGRNMQIEYRWAAGSPSDLHRYATELVALNPEVIFAAGSASLGSLLQVTRNVPIVFAIVPDPVGSGFVDSLSRPALRNYRIPAFADTPRTEVVFADTHDKIGPLGAKSQGECAINAVAPAVANATALIAHRPFTPDRIFDKLGVATCP